MQKAIFLVSIFLKIPGNIWKYFEKSGSFLRFPEIFWDEKYQILEFSRKNKYWKSNLPIFNEPWLIHHETFSPLIELSALLSKIIARCHLFQFSYPLSTAYIFGQLTLSYCYLLWWSGLNWFVCCLRKNMHHTFDFCLNRSNVLKSS